MSKSWFYANTWSSQIDIVQVEKFSDSSVWVRGRRRVRRTVNEIYAPTWAEAHSWLTGYWDIKLKDARRQLELVHGRVGNVKGLRAPDQPGESGR